METVPGVDKETVKAAVLEILEGIPSFRAFAKQGNPDPTQTASGGTQKSSESGKRVQGHGQGI